MSVTFLALSSSGLVIGQPGALDTVLMQARLVVCGCALNAGKESREKSGGQNAP